jgi:nucleoside-diphosphate-sugar epimerase
VRRRLETAGLEVVTAGRSAHDTISLSLDRKTEIDARGLRANCIIHCAAAFEPDTIQGMALNARVNAQGAFVVAALALALEARHIVYVSSLSAFEHPDNAYFGSYGLSKRQGQENLALFCARYGLRLAVVMPSQIVDIAGETRHHQPLFWALMDAAAAGRDTTLYGRSDPMRNFVFIDDVAGAIGTIAERGEASVFICLGPDRLSVGAVASLAQEVFGRGGRVVYDAARPDMKSIWVPDDSTSWPKLGITPKPLRSLIGEISKVM